ncbi:MAG: sensor histidine kinase [Bacteroidetes bacterium]|nr:sensor histidine kinase [Bacteroidota bacterium]
MKTATPKKKWPKAPLVYELLVWLIYVCIFKYDHYLRTDLLPRLYVNWPFPQIILYSVCMTLYVIPFYRWIGPWLLRKQRYVLLFFVTIFYFAWFSKFCNWGVTWVFKELNTDPLATKFYDTYFHFFSVMRRGIAFEADVVPIDLLAFFSIMMMRYALFNERRKYELENDNLALQLETLKAQLHPHFLFNTLNNIYGMSLVNAEETPSYILRLSDMMRYVLYDCRQHFVPLEKDMQFLDNYLAMEKKRYPEANIDFSMSGDPGQLTIAPMLFIQFVENSFKHGAYRLQDTGFVKGRLEISDRKVHFHISNDILSAPGKKNSQGGIGIENVQKRLEMYYPGRYTLDIQNDGQIFTVDLKIQL